MISVINPMVIRRTSSYCRSPPWHRRCSSCHIGTGASPDSSLVVRAINTKKNCRDKRQRKIERKLSVKMAWKHELYRGYCKESSWLAFTIEPGPNILYRALPRVEGHKVGIVSASGLAVGPPELDGQIWNFCIIGTPVCVFRAQMPFTVLLLSRMTNPLRTICQ